MRVPKEIKTYKERIIGTMDLRQLICATIAFIYSAGIIYFLVWKLHWSMD
ncbi:MAG: PrgI family protein, partial [Lacticaseibacillus paracasei]